MAPRRGKRRTVSEELRLRAFFAVQAGVEQWELIRDLAERNDALEQRLAEIERPRGDEEPHDAKT